MSLNASVSVQRNTLIAKLEGELDESNLSHFKIRLSEIMEDYNINNVIFNLEKISFMDSSAIGLILGRYRQVIRRNGKVVLCGINDNLSNILKLSGLLKICLTTENEDLAKELLG